MATWQFTMHCLPRYAIEKRYHAVPIIISPDDFDNSPWWRGSSIAEAAAADLDSWLPRCRSWSSQLSIWGEEDGNCIKVFTDGADLSDISVRIDVRSISFRFVGEVVRFAQKYEFMFIVGKQYVVEPSISKVLKMIHSSASFRFVVDPEKFLAELGRSLDPDLETKS